ncbi:Roquin-1 [Frankliniella fusca]|uniref:Roquin-1 n=1 Tax=Frankliniella fusca TaxID=407009 RepID=A0AAE1HWQ9_9NEOP|nr:Roquin-1 [Frankliniella fusca]
MECEICCEALDQAARVPKTVVPCGHTACLQCLQRCERRECPTCRTAYSVAPESLPKTFALLKLIEQREDSRLTRGWCSDCRAAATRRCLDEHSLLSLKAAERRLKKQALAGALQEAAALLQDVQCQGEEVLHALTLLSAPSWEITLRAGGRQLNGTLANTDNPLIKALWVVLARSATLTQSGADGPAGDGPPPAAARPPAAALDPPPAAARPPAAALDPPPAEAPPPREMDVDRLSRNVPGGRQEEKAAALLEAQGVVRLVMLRCHIDPAWSLELLQRAAPTVERLEVGYPREPHLRAVLAMPRLRRLAVGCADDALHAAPPELGALPPGHSGLRWFSVLGLPSATLQSLLRAHGGTLEELELLVGTPGKEEWPRSCSDLHSLLGRCGLRALRRLVLRRGGPCSHTDTGCREQLAAVRAALPGVQVLCDECDDVQGERP